MPLIKSQGSVYMKDYRSTFNLAPTSLLLLPLIPPLPTSSSPFPIPSVPPSSSHLRPLPPPLSLPLHSPSSPPLPPSFSPPCSASLVPLSLPSSLFLPSPFPFISSSGIVFRRWSFNGATFVAQSAAVVSRCAPRPQRFVSVAELQVMRDSIASKSQHIETQQVKINQLVTNVKAAMAVISKTREENKQLVSRSGNGSRLREALPSD